MIFKKYFLALSVILLSSGSVWASGTQTFSKELISNPQINIGASVIYELKSACNSNTGDCGDLTIEDNVPDGLEIKSCTVPTGFTVDECPVGGDHIRITKDEKFEGGDSFNIKVKLRVKLDSSLAGESIKNTASATISDPDNSDNGTLSSTSDAITVKEPTVRWHVTKARVLPSTAISPALDNPVTYTVQLCSNQAVGNKDLTGVELRDTIPSGAEVLDAGGATQNGNDLVWNLDDSETSLTTLYGDTGYYSERCIAKTYTLKYPKTNFDINDTVTNSFKATSNEKDPIGTADVNDTISDAQAIPSVSKIANDVLPKEDLVWNLSANLDTANAPISNVVIYDKLPNVTGVKPKSVTSGQWNSPSTVDGNSSVQAKISYSTDSVDNCADVTNWIPLSNGYIDSPDNPISYDLSNITDKITCIRWEMKDNSNLPTAPKLPIGWAFTTAPTLTQDTTSYQGDIPVSVENCMRLSYTKPDNSNDSTQSCFTANIENATPANAIAKYADPSYDVKPGDTVTYTLNYYQDQRDSTGASNNPTIVDLMPSNLEFVNWDEDGNLFEIDGLPDNAKEPYIEVIHNDDNTTSVKFTWSDSPSANAKKRDGSLANGESNAQDFNETTNISIRIKARVKDGTEPQSITNKVGFFDSANPSTCINPQPDSNDLDGDGNTDETVCYNESGIVVISAAVLGGDKWIKGDSSLTPEFVNTRDVSKNDQCPVLEVGGERYTRYPCVAQTTKGGEFKYLISVKNVGNIDLKNYILYDMLPKKGDTGTGQPLSASERGSEWKADLTGAVTAVDGTVPDGITPKIEYSTSDNPCRPEVSSSDDESGWQDGCEDDWSETLPNNPAKVTAFRIRFATGDTNDDAKWKPLEEIQFIVPMKAAKHAPGSDVNNTADLHPAWNSFAHRVSYDDGSGTDEGQGRLPTAEPKMVGIVVPRGPEVAIGSVVWFDKNDNGVQDSDEKGIEGAIVKLYDDNGTVAYDRDGREVQAQTTGADGTYYFGNLEEGNYTVQVTPPSDNYLPSDVQNSNDNDDNTTDSNILGSGYEAGSYRSGVFELKHGGEPTGESSDLPNNGDNQDDGTNGKVADDSGNMSVDFGFLKLACIGDKVWEDKNANGVQDDGENGIAGAKVEIFKDGNDTALAEYITSDSGNYNFCRLQPGDYHIKVTPPSGYLISPKDAGGDDAKDSDIDDNGISDSVTVDYGDNYNDLDAGVFATACIGDKIWLDTNGNGIQDDGDVGVAGATVEILDENGRAKDINGSDTNVTTTGDNGEYHQCNLRPGKYKIRVTLPSGYYLTSKDAGDDAKDSDIDPSTLESDLTDLDSNEDDRTWDAGVFKPACVGDRVWEDMNANGIQDDGEIDINGTTVKLTDSNGNDVVDVNGATVADITADNGSYSFCNLKPGDYIVKFTPPQGTYITKQNIGDEDKDSDINPTDGKVNVTLHSDDNNTDIDAGIFKPACIGNYIWEDKNIDGIQDSNESGVAGAIVKLIYANGDSVIDASGNAVADITTTDGKYEFCNLVPNSYKVEVIAPTKYLMSKKNKGNDATKDSDAGDFLDTNGTTAQTTLVSDENDSTWDAGVFKYACLGDKVWYDTNANGIQDSDENGISDVKVELFRDGNATAIDTMNTDSNGNYKFCKLTPANYHIKVTVPNGYAVSTKDAGDDAKDSDINKTGESEAVAIKYGEDNMTIDAGIYKTACLGDRVWEDTNANGIQDAGELGISGVTVKILDENNQSVTDVNGNAVVPLTTDENGTYHRCDLVPGKYRIEVVKPNGYIATTKGATDNSKDSDIDPTTLKSDVIDLASKEDNRNLDAGFFKPACLGDFVWEDTNANGIQDEGESGVANIQTRLLDSNGSIVSADINGASFANKTDSNGKYEYCNLKPGEYRVQFTIPKAYYATRANVGDDSNDSDAGVFLDSDKNVSTPNETLTSGEDNRTLDLGIFKPACLGDFVWEDKNANGIQESGEKALKDVNVTIIPLTDANGNKNMQDVVGNTLGSVTTDENGKYSYCKLIPGDYKVEFEAPSGYYITRDDVNTTTDDKDSDAKGFLGTTGESSKETLISGENNTTIDAGMFKPACLGDFVFKDKNGNGIQDDADEPFEGVHVTILPQTDAFGNKNLKDVFGNVLGRQDTNATGGYKYCQLIPGDYKVAFSADADAQGTPFITTKKDAGSDDAKDSDIEEFKESNGTSNVESLVSGENNVSLDAGYIQELCLGDKVWEDTNANGIQESGENALEGVKVTLTYADGSAVKDVYGNDVVAMDTNASGNYKFCHLQPAKDYKIVFTKPEGYIVTTKDVDGNTKEVKDSDIDNNSTIVVRNAVVDNFNLDAGFFRPACLGDKIWLDTNANGIQDEGESGVSGVKMEVLNPDGSAVSVGADGSAYTNTQDTNASGGYKFCNLRPNSYFVKATAPDGYYITRANVGDDTKDSDLKESFNAKVGTTDTETLISGENNMTLDGGIFKAACIGNFVWDDKNANGIQESGEKGIDGVEVTITPVADSFGNVYNKDLDGNDLGAMNTDSNGTYNFCQLVPGSYKVSFKVENGYYVTKRDVNSTTDAKDSDAGEFLDKDKVVTAPVETLSSGENNTTIDEGLFKGSCVGSKVWLDKNANGLEDDGELGLGNVKITLLYGDGSSPVTDANKDVVETYTTGNDGSYEFCNLIPGTYRVKFEASKDENGAPYVTTGSSDNEVKGSDIPEYILNGGMSEPVTLASSKNYSFLKAGYIQEICLGNSVWFDENTNGVYDSNEKGVRDIPVTLLNTDGSVATDIYGQPVKGIKTDKNGKYQFCHLRPAKDYKIKFKLPKGYHPTFKNKVSNENIDSDANEDGTITIIKPVQDDMTLDTGIYCDCDDYKVHPERYKKLSASALNFAGLLALIFTMFGFVRKERL